MVDRVLIDSVVTAVCAGNLRAIERLVSWPSADITMLLNPSADSLFAEPLPFLRRYWDQLPRGQRLPLMSAVDPLDMAPALGQIVLIDVLDDGWEARYRLFGSELTGPYGTELTGKTMAEGLPPISLALHVAFLRIVLRTGAPLFTHHYSPPEITVMDWRRLMLPLEGPDGTIRRIMTGSIQGPWRPPLVQR